MTPYYDHNGVTIYHGDCLAVLRELPAESINCCVTSPPYWGLRDYGTAAWDGGDDACDHVSGMARNDTDRETPGGRGGSFRGGEVQFHNTCGKCGARRIDAQLGLEATPTEYVAKLVEVFCEVRRVLRDDGTVWLNLGDSYAAAPVGSFNGGGFKDISARNGSRDLTGVVQSGRMNKLAASGLKPKDLVGIPWMTAFALRADGWWLRSDIVWNKPSCMPESVTDRCTKSHEYIFLLSKCERYYYDAEAIREEADLTRAGKIERTFSTSDPSVSLRCDAGREVLRTEYRNKRSVWTVSTQSYNGAHFATFPEDLIKPCILAGCPAAGIVLDPFFGSGTTGKVAKDNQCRCIGIELNQSYCDIAVKRLEQRVFNFTG